MHKLGSLQPIIFYVNHQDPAHPEGYILLAPYSEFPTPAGYSREEAGTLPEVDRLQKRLQEQSRREWEAEYECDEAQWVERCERTRGNLYARLASSATSEWDKEFIRNYLQLREEKRDKYKQRFFERTAYLHAREFDLGDRAADKEEVRLDRLEVK